MDTRDARKQADDTSAYRAQILIKSKGQIVQQVSDSFARRSTAETWMRQRAHFSTSLARPNCSGTEMSVG